MQHNHSVTNQKAPDYDIHMPESLTFALPVGIVSVTGGGLVYFLMRKSQPKMAGLLAGLSILSGGLYVGLCAFLKRLTNLERRLEARDRLLAEIPWQGDETVLDVGCGNGILILAAAKRLTSGNGIGIDIWTDFSGDQRLEAFQQNAELEGVADRVSLENEDVRQLPYDHESFDVIISGLTMHHMRFDAGRAMSEMVRVLKPGGRIAIYDEPATVFYCARLMRQSGLHVEKKTTDMIFGSKPQPVSV